MKVRRVITGLDAEGRSCVALDETLETISGGALKAIWASETLPARNDGEVGAADINFNFGITKNGGSGFMIVEVPMGPGLGGMGMHATDTLDYGIVVRGTMELVLETGSVVLNAGDVFVDRGVLHGARSLGDTPAVMAVVLVPAHPVGKGATV
jgi:quercetin dioxygenase-like cupin family protein